MLGVRLGERLAVQIHHLVHQPDVIARHAHHALHVILLDVHRVAEHDDVAALRLRVRQQVARERSRRRVGQLVHQKVIAHHHRGVHGRRRHDEGLHQRGGAEQQDQDVQGPLMDEVPRRIRRIGSWGST